MKERINPYVVHDRTILKSKHIKNIDKSIKIYFIIDNK